MSVACSGIVHDIRGEEQCQHGFYVAGACSMIRGGMEHNLPCCNEALSARWCGDSGKPIFEQYKHIHVNQVQP